MIRFLDQLPQLSPEESIMQKWGLEEVCSLHSLSASNVLPLAALFHSDNLEDME